MPVLAAAALATILSASPQYAVDIPPEPPARVWYAISGGDGAEPGGVYLQGDVGYAGPVSVGLTLNYRRIEGFRPRSAVAVAVGREIDPRVRIDLQLWRDLSRRGRGAGGALTIRF